MDTQLSSSQPQCKHLRIIRKIAGKRAIVDIRVRYTGFLYDKVTASKRVESTKKKSKHNGHYDTPKELGMKWQMDVKYVPKVCFAGTDMEKFYQYTMLEETDRKRFICTYRENSRYSTCDFI